MQMLDQILQIFVLSMGLKAKPVFKSYGECEEKVYCRALSDVNEGFNWYSLTGDVYPEKHYTYILERRSCLPSSPSRSRQ